MATFIFAIEQGTGRPELRVASQGQKVMSTVYRRLHLEAKVMDYHYHGHQMNPVRNFLGRRPRPSSQIVGRPLNILQGSTTRPQKKLVDNCFAKGFTNRSALFTMVLSTLDIHPNKGAS